jgi:type I restriction-modification system DNA methylase subunit
MAEITEWTFAAQAATWMTMWLHGRRAMPFTEAKVEQKATESAKRRDLSLLARDGKKALTGEIRFPDAKDGETPYNAKLVTDARRKAARAGAPFFFTWNVNRLVLWPTPGEHEVAIFDVVQVRRREELEYLAVERQIRDEFIPRFLERYAAIYKGEEETGVRPLDQRFITRLESALQNIANVIFVHALERCRTNKKFKKDLDGWMRSQDWLLSDDEELLRDNVDRATRLACYITANKLVFYQALRRNRRFKLPKPEVLAHIDSADRLFTHFRGLFEQAKIVTRDYQTIFDVDFIDRVPFITDHAVEGWRILVKLLNDFDFRHFGQDVIGHIFEDLLSPEERHRWGQHYTQPAIVDVINAFCIRQGNAVVLDPASGSGTFPVRAYARKKYLSPALKHGELLAQLYTCEISDYAAHLTALNLATRDLIDGENFPRVANADFLGTRPELPFCSVPDTSRNVGVEATQDIYLGTVDAVVGNPPYLRQEEIGKQNKKGYSDLLKSEWQRLKLSGRSDLHIYFWPHACKLLPEGGYFGFLTSSSWLEVEYGFHLQRWILQNFELVAVLESICEPWFTGARVATSVTILRRCSDQAKRAKNLVRFVQLRKPLMELLENDGTETGRQEAAERLHNLIESTTEDVRTADYRILVVSQQKLWDDGCKLGETATDTEEDTQHEDVARLHEETSAYQTGVGYLGGKWGVYLRAPDLYFELMEKYGARFTPLGKIAEVRYGVKSGCDDFFMPLEITQEALQETDPTEFKRRYRCDRNEVAKDKIRIVRAGDGSEHPIEASFLKPVFIPEDWLKNILIPRDQLRQKLLWVSERKATLKGKHVLKYLLYGEHETFGDGEVVPEKPSCKSRPNAWYDLTESIGTQLLLPKGQQYGNIVFYTAKPMLCNSRVYNITAPKLETEKLAAAVLNSTLAALWRSLYSRALGREGAADIMVVDVKMMPVPDWRKADKQVLKRLEDTLDEITGRQIQPFLETAFAECKSYKEAEAVKNAVVDFPGELQSADRQKLDDAVLELIGIRNPEERARVRERLYREIALFYRQVRLMELQAIENKKRAKKGRTASPGEVAQEIFVSLDRAQLRRFPDHFLPEGEPLDTVELPAGKARLYDTDDFYDINAVAVGKIKFALRHRAQAELAKLHVDLDVVGFVKLPVSAEACQKMQRDWQRYAADMQATFQALAVERTDDEDRQEAIIGELNRLLLHYVPPVAFSPIQEEDKWGSA